MPSGGGSGVGGRALVIRFHLAHACKLRSLEDRCSRRTRHAAPAVSSFVFLFLLTDSKQSVLAVRPWYPPPTNRTARLGEINGRRPGEKCRLRCATAASYKVSAPGRDGFFSSFPIFFLATFWPPKSRKSEPEPADARLEVFASARSGTACKHSQ